MPSNNSKYAEEKGIVPNAPPESKDLALKVKELENKLKEKEKEIKKLTSVVENERSQVRSRMAYPYGIYGM